MEILWSWAREVISAICEILPLSGDGQSGLVNQIYMSLTGNGSGTWFGIFARAGLLVSLIAYLKEPGKSFGKAAAGIFRDIINKRFTFKYEDEESVINLTTSSSVNLYAIWNIVTYKISYNLNSISKPKQRLFSKTNKQTQFFIL